MLRRPRKHSSGRTTTLMWMEDSYFLSLNYPPADMKFVEARSTKSNLYGKGEKVEDEEDAFIFAGHESVKPHYRRFINSEKLVAELTGYGFEIEELVEKDGIAVYKDDNPVVVRVVAKKA